MDYSGSNGMGGAWVRAMAGDVIVTVDVGCAYYDFEQGEGLVIGVRL